MTEKGIVMKRIHNKANRSNKEKVGFGYGSFHANVESQNAAKTTKEVGGIILFFLAIGGIGSYLWFTRKSKYNTSEKIRSVNADADAKIRVNKAETENTITILREKSEIKINEHRTFVDNRKANFISNEESVKMSLRGWMDQYHAKYPMPNCEAIPLLDKILYGCSDGHKDAVMFYLLTSMGAICFSKVRSMYLDKKMHAANILSIIEGESGSGKGYINNVHNALFKRHIECDRDKLNEDKGGIIQTAGINVSASKLFEVLRDNQKVHILAVETEIEHVREAFSKPGGLRFSYLRNAFDNDPVYQNNKSKDAVKGNFPLYMNCVFAGTPKAIKNLINEREEEGGSARRFCFPVIPEIINNNVDVELPEGEELEAIRNQIDRWHNKYSYTTIRNVDMACKEYEIDLNYINNTLKDWINNQIIKANEEKIDERRKFGRAFACIAFHCSIVLHMLAGEPTKEKRKARKAVKEMTLYIANYCMERYIEKYSNKPNAIVDTNPISSKSQRDRRQLTEDEILYWYPLRGTKDKQGNTIGYGTIAKDLGVNKDTVRNSFKRYEQGRI